MQCKTYKTWDHFYPSLKTRCKSCLGTYAATQHLLCRLEAIAHYGGACACCGEDAYEFLVIDHIHDDGAQHRRELSGELISYWLKRNGYPPGYQILCANCNMAKQLGDGFCEPHGCYLALSRDSREAFLPPDMRTLAPDPVRV